MNIFSWIILALSAWYMLGITSYLAVDAGASKHYGWVWYSWVQFVMFIATGIGWFLLIPFCLAHAWYVDTTAKRSVDQWSWRALNYVYSNREDGVSGAYAKVWLNSTTQGPYIPPGWCGVGYATLPATRLNKAKIWLWVAWRAYCWSGWRNSCDNLKYVFAWSDGPYKDFTVLGKTYRFGWNSSGLPVF
jgi:hypothetical protein